MQYCVQCCAVLCTAAVIVVLLTSVVLCSAVLCSAVLCCAVLRYVVVYCAVPCYTEIFLLTHPESRHSVGADGLAGFLLGPGGQLRKDHRFPV